MRPSLERDPRRAAEKRLDMEDAQSLNTHLRQCAEVAILLARESDRAIDAAAKRGPAALKAAWEGRRKRMTLARFFATRALMHLRCPARPCKRARCCAGLGFCTAGETLLPKAEIAARGRLTDFIRLMRRPERESEEGFRGEASRGARSLAGSAFAPIQKPAESHDTGAQNPGGQGRANRIHSRAEKAELTSGRYRG
jgi:hypothetical protein